MTRRRPRIHPLAGTRKGIFVPCAAAPDATLGLSEISRGLSELLAFGQTTHQMVAVPLVNPLTHCPMRQLTEPFPALCDMSRGGLEHLDPRLNEVSLHTTTFAVLARDNA